MKCHECKSSKLIFDDRPQINDGSLVLNYTCSNCLYTGEQLLSKNNIKVIYERKK